MPTPDLIAPWFTWLLLPVVLLAGFFLPGYFALQRLGCPLPWAGAFVGSILLQFHCVLFFHVLGLPINQVTLGSSLAVLGLAGWWLAGKRAMPQPIRPVLAFAWRDLAWLIPVIAAGASVLARTLIEPLSGWDNVFRWNHLALLIHAQESLNAYPPVSAGDFRIYPWCDGIPPALAISNLWIYLGTGSTYGGLIAGRVFVEFTLTYGLVWHIAGKLWGPAGSRFAVATLATSSLFMWSLANSQETGLTGVALLAMTAFAVHYRETPRLDTAIWLMLSAALAALTRDYNLLFLPVAVLVLLMARAPRAHWLSASVVAALLVCPWYIRNAWLTGNPLYAEDLGGLLPTNPYHGEFTRTVRDYWALWGTADNHWRLLRNVLQSSGWVVLLGGLGLVRRKHPTLALPLIASTAMLLWLASVSSTAGGWGYSLRVLGPALPLFAVCAGSLSIRLKPKSLQLIALALVPFSLHAARIAWTIPSQFNQPIWPYTWQSYREITTMIKQLSYPQVWTVLAHAAAGEGIIVDHPMNVVLGGQAGGLMISLPSPEASVLIQNTGKTDFTTVRRTLRAQHIRFLVLSIDTPMNARLLKAWPAIRAIRETAPTVQIGGMLIYDLAVSDDEPPPRRRLVTGP